MRNACILIGCVLLACLTVRAHGPNDIPSTTTAQVVFEDPALLASELRRIAASLTPAAGDRVLTSLPQAWRVRTPDAEYVISTVTIRDLLNAPLDDGSGNRRVAGAKRWLEHAATQLESYSAAQGSNRDARAHLDRILTRPEFAGNAPPNAWERFWMRMQARVARFIERLLRFAGAHPTTGSVVFWCCLVGTLALIAFLLFKLWSRPLYQLNLSRSAGATGLRNSEEWLRAGIDAASNEADFRRAIQCAYWAGVSRLQECGVLPRSTSNTPRELLRLLSSETTLGALRTLTSYLERFWYGRANASAEDFSACIRCLEDLGCKVG